MRSHEEVVQVLDHGAKGHRRALADPEREGLEQEMLGGLFSEFSSRAPPLALRKSRSTASHATRPGARCQRA